MDRVNICIIGEAEWSNKVDSSLVNDVWPYSIHVSHINDFETILSDAQHVIWEPQEILHSHIVIVDLNNLNAKTQYLLGMIDAFNLLRDKHIYVLGLGSKDAGIPSYIKPLIFHKESIMEDLTWFINAFLLQTSF